MLRDKTHHVYVLKHERTKSAYVRPISTAFKEPQKSYLFAPLRYVLSNRLPICPKERYEQIKEHLQSHKLSSRPVLINNKLAPWHDEWTTQRLSTLKSPHDLSACVQRRAKKLLEEGWVVLNPVDISAAFFKEHYAESKR